MMSCVPGRADLKDKQWTGKIVQITKEMKKQLGELRPR